MTLDDNDGVGKKTVTEIEDAKVVRPNLVRHYTPATEEEKILDRKVNLKCDFVVLLILAINFILCGIDKTNIGFVATSSFVKDANLVPDDIPNSLSLFSATYVPLQPLSALAARKLGPRWWLGILMLCWGTICMAHAAIQNRATLIALRLLLGAAEAGFTPAAFYYLSLVYPKYSLGLRMGLFAGMYSIAGAFAGLLAYALLGTDSGSGRLRGWQAVFLLEGGLTVFMAFVTLAGLPSDVGCAWFLNDAERVHATRRMERDLADAQEVAEYDEHGALVTGMRQNKIAWRDIVDVLMDWKKLLIIVFNILAVLPVTAFTTFLPLVVQGMGYSGIRASLMSVPPFTIGTVGLIIVVYSSDRSRERSLHIVGGMALGLVGCVVMATSNAATLRYAFANVCMAGIFIGGPLVAVWLAGNTPWKTTRSLVLGINGWSNVAGVIAGQLFKSQYAPSYRYPLSVTMVLIAVGMVGFVFVRVMYMLENRRRRKIISGWDDERFVEEQETMERRGDQRYTWIYGY